jgi:hypothetical protein
LRCSLKIKEMIMPGILSEGSHFGELELHPVPEFHCVPARISL